MRLSLEKLELVILKVFVRARRELMAPPVFLERVEIGDTFKIAISKRGLRVCLPEDLVARRDFEEILLWIFRHALAHAHYCPYDIVTMKELLRAAYSEVGNWELAHFALHLFADAQVDYFYLRNIFLEIPKHIYYRFEIKPSGPDQIVYAMYKNLFPDIKEHRISTLVYDTGKQLAVIAKTSAPWLKKIRLMARVLSKAVSYQMKEVSKKAVAKYLKKQFISVREDFSRRGFEDITTVLSEMKDENEVKAFFDYVLSDRVDTEKTLKKIKEYLEKMKKTAGKIEKAKPPSKYAGEEKGLEEPFLPTKLAKPIGKIHESIIRDAIWRSYWHRARAEKALIEFIQKSRALKPTWAVAQYPDDWTVEDELEELDLEATFEEGPLIPEVNAVKWIRKASFLGQSIASGYIPSALIVLDSSKSMVSIFDDAATAAHIVYLSAKRKGGKTAVITFSSNYVVADWDAESRIKEIILSLRLGQMTILPVHEIGRLVGKLTEPCFIIIITDCGWQNIVEALPYLSHLASKGNRIVVFHLVRGWKYPKSLSLVKKTHGVKIVPVEDPENDLRGLVLEEVAKVYEIAL